MKLTSEERKSMIERRYVSDMNHPIEMSSLALDVRRNAGGFTVVHQLGDCTPVYTALTKYLKRFPYQLEQELAHERA